MLVVRSLFTLFSFALLASCVGEVDSSKKPTTISSPGSFSHNLSFTGIDEAVAISNSKVEVYFPAAQGGSFKFVYHIYVGNQPDPISVSEEVLEKDYRGLYRYTINNLDIGTLYSIKIDVQDTESGHSLATTNSDSVYTFINYVAEFSGISSVQNAQGVAGIDSIHVSWPHASVPGGIFDNGDGPKNYEITLIDSSKLTPAAFDDLNLTVEDGRIVKTILYNPLVTSTIVQGLRENTTYYVNVRCVHEKSIEDIKNLNLRGEQNHRYKEIKTLTQNASSINYNADEFIVNTNTGALSSSTLLVNWGEVVGVFDHFRVYYARSPHLAVNTGWCSQEFDLLAGDTLCKKVDTSLTSSILSDLSSQLQYQVRLLVCLDAYCDDYVEMPTREQVTTTNLATFVGVDRVLPAQDIDEIGVVTLEFTPPDFNTGYFHGLAIEFTTERNDLMAFLNGQGPMPTTHLIREEPVAGHDLTHDYFEYETDDRVVIRGVDYQAEQSYCFSIYPYNYDISESEGIKYFKENMVWRCETIGLYAPGIDEFEGLDYVYTVENQIAINWPAPSSGIYSHFEIFYRNAFDASDLNFNFETAAEETTVYFDYSNYQRILIDRDGVDASGDSIIVNSRILENLDVGYYLIGIQTYYNAGVGRVVRSPENDKIYQCHVSGVNNLVDCMKI